MWLLARASKGLPSSVVTAINTIWAPILLIYFLPSVQFPWDKWWWYLYLILPMVLMPISTWTLTHACQRIDVTIIKPLSSLSTIATLFVSMFIFSKSFELIHIIGIFVITIGLLSLYHNRWNTIRSIWLWLAIFAIIIMGINGSVIKEVLSVFPHPIALIAFGATGEFAFVSFFGAKNDWNKIKWTRNNISLVTLFSIIVFAQSICTFLALSLGPAPHVIAIKRTSILLAALGGYWIFKERDQSLVRLVVSCVVVVMGVILLNI